MLSSAFSVQIQLCHVKLNLWKFAVESQVSRMSTLSPWR